MDLIFIHGPVASGKLTVAGALAKATGLSLFHNHLVVDAVAAVFPFGSEPFVRLREDIWLQVFTEAARAGTSLIFTFAPEASVRPDFPARAITAVEAHGGRVRFVGLTCPADVQEQRLVAASRRGFGKLTSLELFRELSAAGALDYPPLPAEVSIDTTALAPEAAAKTIGAALGLPAVTASA